MRSTSSHLPALLLVAVLGLAAPASRGQDNESAREARQIVAGIERAWNSHDMEAFASLFADDADFVNIEGTRWRGRAAIKDAHAFVHATIFKQSRLTIDDTTFTPLTPEVVVARSTWRLEGQTTMKGAPVPGRTGILTNVLVRSGAGWKIAVTQNTDIVP